MTAAILMVRPLLLYSSALSSSVVGGLWPATLSMVTRNPDTSSTEAINRAVS
jgi:hypothetical protein